MKNDIDSIISLMRAYTPSSDKGEMGEQDAAPAAGGGGGGAKPAYPTVTKWESGRTLGPTYKGPNSKWESGLTRGKANTLI